jgi:hypothetical protein
MTRGITFLTVLIIFMTISAFGQNGVKSNKSSLHNEIPNDKYIPTTGEVKTSPAYTIRTRNVFTTQVNIDANGYNIVGDAANEPSIAIDPSNPNRMVIGWRQFNTITSDFRQAGYGYSTNGGNNWVFPGVIQPGIFRSDPVLDCDKTGRFFYNSLTFIGTDVYMTDVFKNIGTGFTWDGGTDAQGGDKQWMVIDKTNSSGAGHIYSNWNWFYSICKPKDFTRSINSGSSYENCVKVDGAPHWGTLAVGPDGELYTVGADDYDNIVIAKSTTAKNPSVTVSWDFFTEIDLDGELSGWIYVNPQGLLGQAYVGVDVSGGPGHGNVYILAAVDRLSNGDPGDIMFSKSTDGGNNWLAAPIKINDDATTTVTQWFGTMSVAPNGRIDVVWLDTRDFPTVPIQSALYYSYSTNQGTNWSANDRISDYFDSRVGWPNQAKMGDYFHMISDNNAAHLAWCNTIGGEQNVYYTRITAVSGINEIENNKLLSLSGFPNPAADQAMISYTLPDQSNVKLVLSDIIGNEIKVINLIDESAGLHSITLNTGELPAGVYFCNLTACGTVESYRLVIVK